MNLNTVNGKLKIWRDALESSDFQLNKTKTFTWSASLGKNGNKDEWVVKLDSQVIPKGVCFQYLKQKGQT